MRVPAALLTLTITLPAIALAQPKSPAKPASDAKCERTQQYLADQSSLYRGKPLAPKKLTELPPATTYMAVYRHIGGCEAPLTMVEYRNPRHR